MQKETKGRIKTHTSSLLRVVVCSVLWSSNLTILNFFPNLPFPTTGLLFLIKEQITGTIQLLPRTIAMFGKILQSPSPTSRLKEAVLCRGIGGLTINPHDKSLLVTRSSSLSWHRLEESEIYQSSKIYGPLNPAAWTGPTDGLSVKLVYWRKFESR